MNYFKKNLLFVYNAVRAYFYRVLWSIAKRSNQPLKILTVEQTLKELLKDKKSIARFGDGEFSIMNGTGNPGFQHKNQILQARLQEIIKSEQDHCLIALPESMRSLKLLNSSAKNFWAPYLHKNIKRIEKFVNPSTKYANSFITRPYLDFKDKKIAYKNLSLIRQLWKGREVIIIEGNATKFGINNDLLSNAKKVSRLITRSINAFELYDQILAEAQKMADANGDPIFLIALGPTATVLVYDLSKLGYQAIDIGHLDVEYEWKIMGAKTKEIIKGKQVNELNYIPDDVDSAEDVYKGQHIKYLL